MIFCKYKQLLFKAKGIEDLYLKYVDEIKKSPDFFKTLNQTQGLDCSSLKEENLLYNLADLQSALDLNLDLPTLKDPITTSCNYDKIKCPNCQNEYAFNLLISYLDAIKSSLNAVGERINIIFRQCFFYVRQEDLKANPTSYCSLILLDDFYKLLINDNVMNIILLKTKTSHTEMIQKLHGVMGNPLKKGNFADEFFNYVNKRIADMDEVQIKERTTKANIVQKKANINFEFHKEDFLLEKEEFRSKEEDDCENEEENESKASESTKDEKNFHHIPEDKGKIKDIDQLLSYINEGNKSKKNKRKKNKKKKKGTQGGNGETQKDNMDNSTGISSNCISPNGDDPNIMEYEGNKNNSQSAKQKEINNAKTQEALFEKFKAMIRGDTINKYKIHKIKPNYPKEWLKYIESL